MLAAQGRHTETVKALIEAGVDVNLVNSVSSYDLHSGLLPGVAKYE